MIAKHEMYIDFYGRQTNVQVYGGTINVVRPIIGIRT